LLSQASILTDRAALLRCQPWRGGKLSATVYNDDAVTIIGPTPRSCWLAFRIRRSINVELA